MWLIRTNKITTKEYNLVARKFKKIWFYPRRLTPMTFIKAMWLSYLQKKSWRKISKLLNCNYISLYNFDQKYNLYPEIYEIFHSFINARIFVYVGENKHFTCEELDNSNKYLKLTLKQLNHIF